MHGPALLAALAGELQGIHIDCTGVAEKKTPTGYLYSVNGMGRYECENGTYHDSGRPPFVTLKSQPDRQVGYISIAMVNRTPPSNPNPKPQTEGVVSLLLYILYLFLLQLRTG